MEHNRRSHSATESLEQGILLSQSHNRFSRKSFLVAVIIIYLHKLAGQKDDNQTIKILIASNTNVAVDRILLSLRDLGFEDFVRVGSLKKIAKRVLPHTVQVQTASDDIRELQRMLQEDSLTGEEER